MKIKRNIRLATENINITHPFEQSIVTIIILHCEKVLAELYKGNYIKAEEQILIVERDLQLIAKKSYHYPRLKSMYLNTKSLLKRKTQKKQQALHWINQAISFQNKHNLLNVDRARTLLNKCIIVSQIGRDQTQNGNLFSQSEAISIAKDALQLLKQRPTKILSPHSNCPRLNEHLVLSFCNAAKQLSKIHSNKQSQQIYRNGYQIAIKNLGLTHKLTNLLRKICNQNKSISKVKSKMRQKDISQCQRQLSVTYKQHSNYSRTMTESMDLSTKDHKKKKLTKNRRQKLYSRYYGYNNSRVYTQESKLEKKRNNEPQQMKQLENLKLLYKPHKRLENYNQFIEKEQTKKNIKDIILKNRTTISIKQSLQIKLPQKISSKPIQSESGKKLSKINLKSFQSPSKVQKIVQKKLIENKKLQAIDQKRPIQDLLSRPLGRSIMQEYQKQTEKQSNCQII